MYSIKYTNHLHIVIILFSFDEDDKKKKKFLRQQLNDRKYHGFEQGIRYQLYIFVSVYERKKNRFTHV